MTPRPARGVRATAIRADADRTHVPAAAARAATAGPWLTLVLGALLGGISAIYNRSIAATLFVGCLAGCGVLLIASERVRWLSRWTAASSLIITLAFTGGLCAIGGAIASVRLSGPTLALVLVLYTGVAALIWRNAVKRRESEWERARVLNEGEIVDLGSGTFDLTRGFTFGDTSRSQGSASVARALPWVAAGSAVVAGSGSHLHHGFREYLLMVAGPVVFLAALPGIALIFTTRRKIVTYERQLGRDIVNR